MSQNKTYDVIIAGSGSIGTPIAMYMAQAGLNVLVIESLPSNGQASNKHAIGGVRATHSDPSKIYLCAEGINILSSWQETYGDDIEWRSGGYCFIAYEPQVETTLKDLLGVQKQFGLNIDWCSKQEILTLVPDLQEEGLLGGTFSPEDGSASPLKVSYAFYSHAKQAGAEFHFNETVTAVRTERGKISQVVTDKGVYSTRYFVNAAGSWAAQVSDLVGIPIPVQPEAHEAGITEPVQPMFAPMVVDIRPRVGSSNFYFYQHPTGKIIFCLTPAPQILGNLNLDTSSFLPLASQRLIELMPKLMNCRVRRTWRGTYPITPDGLPILGPVDELEGYLLAVGVCGQGFMLGPGVGELLTHLIMGSVDEKEQECLTNLRLNRAFTSAEKLK
ncbi:MAG: FAD-dependent oxidoreductase [Anaerolineaceae bacterium]